MNEDDNATQNSIEIDSSTKRSEGFWSRLKARFFGRDVDSVLKEGLVDVMDELVEDEQSSFGTEERSIINNTLTFRKKRVDDIMVPRTDIIAVEAASTFEELMGVFIKGTTSRLPIYHETLDEVIAMVHIKDAFRELVTHRGSNKERKLQSIQRPILFVPPSMKLFDLLTKMQLTHIHMALVVDEYGGTDGLLTIEDLVEQIVGDIEDEHDVVEEELLREMPNGDLMADARLAICDLEDLLGLDLLPDDQDDDVDTLGGLIYTIAGYIPELGETITDENGIAYKIMEGDARRIKMVCIHRGGLKKRDSSLDQENNQTNIL